MQFDPINAQPGGEKRQEESYDKTLYPGKTTAAWGRMARVNLYTEVYVLKELPASSLAGAAMALEPCR